MELGHTAGALVYLVADGTGHIELDNGGAFWTSSVHSAGFSCMPYESSSSSATHIGAREDAAVL